MALDIEKAQILFKLARNHTWNNVYDRLEHFKRFQHRDDIIKELSKCEWILVHKKAKYVGISINTQCKKDIVAFIELHMPHLKGAIQ